MGANIRAFSRICSSLCAATILGVTIAFSVVQAPAFASAPPTNPACIYYPTDFAAAFLNAIPEPVTAQNTEAIIAWELAEGGNWNNTAKFNPIDTTWAYDGSYAINSVGVQAFNNWNDGVYANVLTITENNRSTYSSILAALQAGDNAKSVTDAIDASPWGTHNATADLGSPYNPPAPSWDTPCGAGGPSSPAILGPQGIADNPSGQATEVVLGPSNSFWVYWQTSNAQWHGPLSPDAPNSTYSAPAVAIGPGGLPTVAVQGPGNSLWVYWEASNAQWYGPLGVGGPGTTFGPPSIAASSSQLPVIVAQGPNNSIYAYWQTSDAQWHGPYGIPNGVADSAPSIAAGTNGAVTVAVQGPSNSLYVYWRASNAQWYGPLGVGAYGSTFSAPSVSAGPGNGLPSVAAEGPNNSLYVYWEAGNAQWYGPLGVGAYGSTFSQPAITDGANNVPTVAVQGPSNSTYLYWEDTAAQWHGPYGLGAAGSLSGSPAISAGSSVNTPTVAAVTPSNSFWVYWQTSDAQWHGPLGIGAFNYNPNYAMSANPSAQTISWLGSGSGTITLTGNPQMNQTVNLTFSGVPSGDSFALSSTTCSMSPNSTCTVNYSVSVGALSNNFTVTITGRSVAGIVLTQSTTVQITAQV